MTPYLSQTDMQDPTLLIQHNTLEKTNIERRIIDRTAIERRLARLRVRLTAFRSKLDEIREEKRKFSGDWLYIRQ